MASVEVREGAKGLRYAVRWRNPGDAAPKRATARTREEADRWAREATKAEAQRVTWAPPSADEDVAGRLLKEAAVEWVEEMGRVGRREGSLDTYAQRIDSFRRWWARGEPRLRDVTSANLRAWDRAMEASERSPSTRRGALTTLRALVRWFGAESHEVRENAAGLERVTLPRVAEPDPVVLPWELIDALVYRMGEQRHGAQRRFAMIARCTGLRRQEICSLTWGMVTLGKAPCLDIPPQITKGGRRGRVLPISRVLAAYLAELPRGEPSRPVVGLTPSSASSATRRAVRALVAEGVLPNRLVADELDQSGVRIRRRDSTTTHLFRRTLQQGLREAGVEGDVVEWMVGHVLPGVKRNYLNFSSLAARAVEHVPPLSAAGVVVLLPVPALA